MNIMELNQRFPDLQKSQQALLRASDRARCLAEQTGTRLIVDTCSKCRLGAVYLDTSGFKFDREEANER